MLMVVRFDIRTEPIHESNAISPFRGGFRGPRVFHDGDRVNLLKQQGEGLSVARLQVTKTYGRTRLLEA